MKDNVKILLVDDNPSFINAIRRMLLELIGSTSCIIRSADNGFEAIQILKGSSFDYIFIDIFMPFLDGIETIRIINRDYYNKDSILIAVSFNSAKECRDRALSAGATYFLRKDEIEIQTLADVLEIGLTN